MKCKKHLGDLSSSVGVCSSCLRDRLFVLIAAQAQAQSQAELDVCHPDPLSRVPQPRQFPRSVSPPVGRHRKSSSSCDHNPVRRPHRHRRRFFSTPQVGPTFSSNPNPSAREPSDLLPGEEPSRFSLLRLLLTKRSDKITGNVPPNPDPTSQPSSSSSIFSLWKKKQQSQASSVTGSSMSGRRRKCSAVASNRGMSPAGGGSDEDESPSNSGYSSEDCPHSWKRTPASSTAFVTPRRVTKTPQHPRSRSGFAFCLSPLVRTNPGRDWKNKGGMQGETGDVAPLCKNRSRKLTDLGRGAYRR
ncbi:hypothetical protein MLD38_023774 [Melastoma candidum]|uniref:Uncharacterized protein n=1 Tax=Melastoma candidum TaxID=119954 RepID=A0ACB9NQE2_9MYRT|nr:hypothetical protein MLD38_023774 [Melastoma candidum]